VRDVQRIVKIQKSLEEGALWNLERVASVTKSGIFPKTDAPLGGG